MMGVHGTVTSQLTSQCSGLMGLYIQEYTCMSSIYICINAYILPVFQGSFSTLSFPGSRPEISTHQRNLLGKWEKTRMKRQSLNNISTYFTLHTDIFCRFLIFRVAVISWFSKQHLSRPNSCITVQLSSNSFCAYLNREKVVQLKKLDCTAALSFPKFESLSIKSLVRSFVEIGGGKLSRVEDYP